MTERILSIFLFTLFTSTLVGQQDSQWRGPDRNGSYKESNLLKENSLYVTGREDSLEYLSCFDLKGTLRWKVPFGKRWQGSFPDSRSTPNVVDHPISPVINVNTPLYHEGMIYISKGYDHEGVMFSISPDSEKIEQVWSDTVLDIHLGGMVLNNGYIYGSNWLHNRDGNWCCLNWETGEVMYETHWKNKGAIIQADGMLYCFEEKGGHMALVEPTPEEFRIKSSFKTAYGSGPAWAHPVIRAGVLYIRRGKAVMAYNIAL